MIKVSQVCQLARYSLGDAVHTRYSDYEMLQALQAALEIFYQTCNDLYSPIAIKKERVRIERGSARVPDDFYSIQSVRELLKRDDHHHHHHHPFFDKHHHDHMPEHDKLLPIPPDFDHDINLISPCFDHDHIGRIPPHDGPHHRRHHHREEFDYGRELEPDYEVGPYDGYYRISGNILFVGGDVGYVELTYMATPHRICDLEDRLDIPMKCQLPLARMTAYIVNGDLESATNAAQEFAISNKNHSYSNPYHPELWGGYNPL